VQIDGNNKGGLNELLEVLLRNENRYISNNELIHLLHRIEGDATEIYHTKYGSYDTRIKFNIDSNGDSDVVLVGRQSAKTLECIRKSISRNLYLMQERVRAGFEGYLILCGECINPA
jgi:hypothetical protein